MRLLRNSGPRSVMAMKGGQQTTSACVFWLKSRGEKSALYVRLQTVHFGHALCRRRLILLRSIFRGTLRLDLLGIENAVATELSFCQRLRIVFKGVRRRLGAVVNDIQC